MIERLLLHIVWPPSALRNHPVRGRDSSILWLAVCTATVVPVTAALHNGLFYRATCMLKPFGADDSLPVLSRWLSRDPSLPWAILLMMAVYFLGNQRSWLKTLVAPAFISFLPLSLWIWDIPFSGRTLCAHFHDGRFALIKGVGLHSKHLYLLSLSMYLIFTAYLVHRKRCATVPRTTRALQKEGVVV